MDYRNRICNEIEIGLYDKENCVSDAVVKYCVLANVKREVTSATRHTNLIRSSINVIIHNSDLK